MIQDDEQEQSYYHKLLTSIKTIEADTNMVSIFSKFIEEQPSKDQITKICHAITKRKKQEKYYHQVSDQLIVIIKLFVDSIQKNMSKDEQKQISQKFKEKVQALSKNLKNDKIKEWIEYIKDKIQKYRLLKQRNIKLGDFSQGLQPFNQNNIFLIATKIFTQQQLEKIRKEDIVQQIITKISLIKGKIYQQINNQELLKKIQSLKNKLAEKDKAIEMLQRKIKQIQGQFIKQKNAKQHLISNEVANVPLLIFDSKIIKKQDYQSINFLGNILSEMILVNQNTKMSILYSSNNQQSLSLHQKIDNKPNILLIVKLKNSKIIGGFTVEEFRPKCYGQKGFLFNLTLKECYKRQRRSTISYNQRYLIFGSNQISIKQKQMIILSNFGSNPNHFSTLDRTINDFIGNGQKRNAQIQLYEIYQIFSQ